MQIATASRLFIKHLRLENKSINSRKTYESRIRQIIRIWHKRTTEDIQLSDIENSMITLEDNKKAIATRYVTANALRAFARFLSKKKVKFVDYRRIIVPTREEVEINYPTDDELRRIYDAIDRMDIIGVRDRALIELYTSSGCRLTEVTQLNIESMNFNTLQFQVIGKRKKRRTCYFSPVAAVWMRLYLHMRGSERAEPALFLSHSLNSHTRISPSAVQRMFRCLVRKLRINRKLSIHSLRHYFATYCLKKGIDIRTLQVFLGHTKLTTTQIYAHVEDRHAREQYMRIFNA